jgi:hypothetical protein
MKNNLNESENHEKIIKINENNAILKKKEKNGNNITIK